MISLYLKSIYVSLRAFRLVASCHKAVFGVLIRGLENDVLFSVQMNLSFFFGVGKGFVSNMGWRCATRL